MINDNLRGGAPARLAKMRAYIKKWNEGPHASTKLESWKEARSFGVAKVPSYNLNNARGPQGQIYTENLDQYGKNIGNANELVRLDHSGWYSDSFQSGLIRGAVVRVRCPRGTLYVPVTYHTEWEGSTHYFGDVELAPKGADEETHDAAIKEAARSADHYAESEAEESREGDAKHLAEADIEEARAEIHVINKKALVVLRELKNTDQNAPDLLAVLRDSLDEMLEDRRAQFAIITARTEDYWSAVSRFY